jgi:hypothetical protein
MASIYRRTRSYPIPSGAEIIERRRKATPAELQEHFERKTIVERFARWTDNKGKARRAPLNAAGDAVMVEAGNYLIAYTDAAGKRQVVNAKRPDKATAQQLANHL